MSTETTIHNQDRSITASRLELVLKRHVNAALGGDLGDAALILKIVKRR